MLKGDENSHSAVFMVSKGYTKQAKVKLNFSKNSMYQGGKQNYTQCGGTKHSVENYLNWLAIQNDGVTKNYDYKQRRKEK
jgi:hypothetical protein